MDGEFLAAGCAGANSLALEITFCNGLEKWKCTFNWPIKRKQSSRSWGMKQKANRICFISVQIHCRLRPIFSTSTQLIREISSRWLLWELWTSTFINKHSENQFLFFSLVKSENVGKTWLEWNFYLVFHFEFLSENFQFVLWYESMKEQNCLEWEEKKIWVRMKERQQCEKNSFISKAFTGYHQSSSWCCTAAAAAQLSESEGRVTGPATHLLSIRWRVMLSVANTHSQFLWKHKSM